MLNLIVVAHPDDEILGLGATGAKLAAAGETVQALLLCGSVDSRTSRPTDEQLYADTLAANAAVGFAQPILGDFPNIRMNTVDHLRIVQFIEKHIEALKPDRIFTHHPADLNDDHRQIARACMAAARLFQRRAGMKPIKDLLFLEIPSSTDWGFPAEGDTFRPNVYEEIGGHLETKLKALACYRGVIRPFPHPRSREGITGLAAVRGGQCGLGYAEAFQSVFRTGLA